MKRMLRKTTVIVLCITVTCVMFGLTGCGNKSDETTYVDKNSKTKEISFFINQSDAASLKIFNEAAEDFEKDTGVKVVYSNYVQDSGTSKKSYDEVAQSRLESDDPDEMYILNAGVMYNEVKKGNLAELTDLKGMDGLKDAAVEGSKVGSKQYCMPLFLTPYGFFANTRILKKYGLSTPTNIDEFYNCCKVLKAKGVKPFEANKWWLEVMALGRGMSDIYISKDTDAAIKDLNDGSTNISKYMNKGFKLVSDMDQKDYLNLAETYNTEPGEEAKDFSKGKCAFMVCMVPAIAESYMKDVLDDTKITGLPVRDDGNILLLNPDMRVCVSSHAKGKDAALGFVRYLAQTKYTEQFAKVDGRYSIRKDAESSNLSLMKNLNKNIKDNRVMPCQNYKINVEQWDNTTQILWKMMDKNWTVQQASDRFDELQKDANK